MEHGAAVDAPERGELLPAIAADDDDGLDLLRLAVNELVKLALGDGLHIFVRRDRRAHHVAGALRLHQQFVDHGERLLWDHPSQKVSRETLKSLTT
jgi:hypothetical protein